MSEARVSVRGMPDNAAITEVNVRGGAGTTQAALFKTPVGTGDLPLLEVAADLDGKNLDGKVYQWFKVRFGDGREGWMRDDLLFLEGDATAWGYSPLTEKTWAFLLTRNAASSTPPAPVAPAVQPAPAVTVASPTVMPAAPAPVVQPAPAVVVSSPTVLPPAPAVTVASPTVIPAAPAAVVAPAPAVVAAPAAVASPSDPNEQSRIRRLAFLITGTFEGHGYSAYNNYDAGIVSYGIIQFTLAAGSLVTVVNRYLERSQSEAAGKLRPYQTATQNRDPMLRNDMGYKAALLAAAADPIMQSVQDEVATEGFWKQVVDGYITPRNMVLPYSYALLFDMGVNFGVNHGFVRLAEQQLGVPTRSVVGTNGVTEQMLITRVAELRKQSHDKQAERDNLPGLKQRGDFWMGLATSGDWTLRGDASGILTVKTRRIDTRNPA